MPPQQDDKVNWNIIYDIVYVPVINIGPKYATFLTYLPILPILPIHMRGGGVVSGGPGS